MLKIILSHKIITGLVIIMVAGGGYYEYKSITGNTVETRYVLAAVEKGTLITSVSGSGQISVTNQVDVKAKASGDILSVNVKSGQEVKAGTTLASINSKEAKKTVRDAESNLISAKLSLEKLKKPADAYSLMQAENAVKSAKASLEKLKKPVDAYSLMQAENAVKSAKASLEKLTKPVDAYSLLQSENAVINARDNLERLKLSQPIDYQKAEQTKKTAEDDLDKAYEDTFNKIGNAFLDLPSVMTGLNNILYGTDISTTETIPGGVQDNNFLLYNVTDELHRDSIKTLQVKALDDYKAARAKYNINIENYKNITRYSDHRTLEDLLDETLETVKAIAQSTKSQSNYLDTWVDYRTLKNLEIYEQVTTYQNDISGYTGTVNSHLSTLSTTQSAITDDQEAIINAENDLKELTQNNPLELAAAEASIKEKEASLKKLKDGSDPLDIAAAEASVKEKEAALKKLKDGSDPLDITAAETSIQEKEAALEKLKDGTDPLDIKTQELMIQQRVNALADAQEKLSDYSVTAPFDGIIANISVKKGDSISSGGTVVTLVTKQKNATISLNEVDMAQVKTGQKTIIIFDAIDGLEITGEVDEIDTLGTVSQGVVTYNVKIIFDTQDERVKSGMSLSASIITEVKQDVVMVPNSAIKTQGDTNYVETLENLPSANQLSVNVTNNSNNTGITSSTPPIQKFVEIGLANDSMTEIVSGLKEGDQIIVRTANGAQTTTAANSGSLFRIPGVGGGSAGAGGTRPRD